MSLDLARDLEWVAVAQYNTECVVTGFAKLDRVRRGEAVPETERAAA